MRHGNQGDPGSSSGARGRLDPETALRLCAAAAATGLRPVDVLLEQHSHERAPEWSIDAARRIAPAIEQVLSSGSLVEIESLRILGKSRFHESESVRDRNAALVVFALCIAAGLDRFGKALSAQPPEEIDVLLAGVARCVPEPWCAMIDRAIMRHGSRLGTADE